MRETLKHTYSAHRQEHLRQRWLRPEDILPHLKSWEATGAGILREAGRSAEGRPIYLLEWGEGEQRLLLWSQMHGNEATATMALIDWLHYLRTDAPAQWRQDFRLAIFPQLNPDGAERFVRENAWGVDLNRDVRARQTPEIQCFMRVFENFRPRWGFNLHDQRNHFTAGTTSKPATLSFLAPSADPSRQITPEREQSMALIRHIWRQLEPLLPGHFGRYSDEFYPRALGDNFHRLGVPCVLFEAGPYPADPVRDRARELIFHGLNHALGWLNGEEVANPDGPGYADIPENGTHGRDLIIRNCQLGEAQVDLSLMLREEVQQEQWQRQFILHEVGDLRDCCGWEEEEGGQLLLPPEGLFAGRPAHFSIKRNDKPNLIFEHGKRNEEH